VNGIHDMGGMHGFGKVSPEPDEPVFHASWEGRVLALQRVLGYAGAYNIDMSRFAQETLPPEVYLTVSYYKRWAMAIEKNLVQRGYATPEEFESGHARAPAKPLKRKMTADDIGPALTRGKYGRPAAAPARFKIGDRVRTKNLNPATHTRLPRYARGRTGTIERIQGCHVFPDTVAIDQGENPQWLYTVLFEGRELWGPESDPSVKVSIEAFEPYLEPA
jgi:nitrile hydratase subunit beta